ncbi:hypothetical protein C8R46DRAFT_1297696 [Mycena filopes]|nr:hypothetical protein C8R46DRAFT_1297696 [Mycena filopes]
MSWFLARRLQPVMQQLSVMHHLGQILLKYQLVGGMLDSVFRTFYLELMQSLAIIPEWRPVLWAELPTWLALLPIPRYDEETFTSVIRSVWAAEFDEAEDGFASKRDYGVALTLTALANVWSGADADSAPGHILQLARHTVTTALSFTSYDGIRVLLGPSMAASYSRLCSSMDRAALNIRATVSTTAESGYPPEAQHSLNRLANFAEELAKAIGSGFGLAQWHVPHKRGLAAQHSSLGPLRKRLNDMVDAELELSGGS